LNSFKSKQKDLLLQKVSFWVCCCWLLCSASATTLWLVASRQIRSPWKNWM